MTELNLDVGFPELSASPDKPPGTGLIDFDLDFSTPVAEAAIEAAAEKFPAKPATAELPSGRAGDCLYLDIETSPCWGREHLFNLPPIVTEVQCTPNEQLPMGSEFVTNDLRKAREMLNGKQPSLEWLASIETLEGLREKPRAGMFDLLNEKRQPFVAASTATEDRIKLLSVTPMYCQIAAIGMAIGDAEPVVNCCPHVADERSALQTLWTVIAKHRPIVGFNVREFDLAVILLRSAILGVIPSVLLDRRKYGSRDIVDLMQELYGDRCPKGFGLKPTCQMLGLIPPPEPGASVPDGSQVYQLVSQNKWDELAAYCASDVRLTQLLHRQFLAGYFCV